MILIVSYKGMSYGMDKEAEKLIGRPADSGSIYEQDRIRELEFHNLKLPKEELNSLKIRLKKKGFKIETLNSEGELVK